MVERACFPGAPNTKAIKQKKLAIFRFIVFCVHLFPEMATTWKDVFVAVGVVKAAFSGLLILITVDAVFQNALQPLQGARSFWHG